MIVHAAKGCPPGLVLAGGAVLTMDAEDRLLPAADIRIVDRFIDAIGPARTLAQPGDAVIDCSNTLVIPGLVNTHSHACTSMFRGLTEDLPRTHWAEGYVTPGQGRFTADDYLVSAQASTLEFLQNGVTCIADRWGGIPDVPAVLEASGIRAVFGYTLTDQTDRADWKTVDALIERWGTTPDRRVSAAIAPHAPDTCSDELLRACAKRAEEIGSRVYIHLAQSTYEIATLRARGYEGALACLAANGLANSRSVAAHCIYLTENELANWGTHRVSVAHCPASNLKIEARTLPVYRLLGSAEIGLGTDWAASDNAMDLLAEARLAAMIGKYIADDSTALSVRTLLRMATIDGARVLGLDQVIGSIEERKYADLVVMDLTMLEANPRHNLRANLLYSMSSRCVRDVLVDGVVLVRGGRFTDDRVPELRESMAERVAAWGSA